ERMLSMLRFLGEQQHLVNRTVTRSVSEGRRCERLENSLTHAGLERSPSLTLRVTYLLPFALALAVCLISPSLASAQSAPADSAAVLALVEEQLVKVIASAEQSVVALGIIKRGAEGVALRVDGFGLEVVPRAVDEHSPEHIPNEFGSGVIITVDNSDEATAERLVLTAYHLVRGGPVVGKEAPAD